MKKIMVTLFCIILIILNQYNFVVASDISQQGQDWLNTGEANLPGNKVGTGTRNAILKLLGKSGTSNEGFGALAGILTAIGVFVVLIVGVILGVRLMFTDPGKKAQAKEALIIYLVGCVIIFGALGIWKIIIEILDADYLYH